MTQRWPIIAFTVLLALAVGWTIIGDIVEAMSQGVDLAQIARNETIFSRGEFWLNRYQTLFIGIATIVTAVIVLQPTLAQAREMRRQSAAASLEILKGEIEEIERAMNAIRSARESFSLVSDISDKLRVQLPHQIISDYFKDDLDEVIQKVQNDINIAISIRVNSTRSGQYKQMYIKRLSEVRGVLERLKTDLVIRLLEVRRMEIPHPRSEEIVIRFRAYRVDLDDAGGRAILATATILQTLKAEIETLQAAVQHAALTATGRS